MTQTIADVVRQHGPRANNFDFIRLAAATLVLVAHSWPLALGHERDEPLMALTGQMTLGHVAVQAFFFVSGMMITASWQHTPSLGAFLWKRALRLFPALIVAVLLSAMVLGPAVTALSRTSYATDPGTWVYLLNALLITVHTLPGVFTGLPYPEAVNGSLWTLPFEIRCYGLVAILGLCGLLAPRMVAALAAVVAVAVIVLTLVPGPSVALHKQAELTLPFALGMLAWLSRERFPVASLRVAGLVVALLLAAALLRLPFFWLICSAAVAIAVPALGYAQAAWPRQLTAAGDFSFGVYLYAFPIQQLLVAVLPGIGVVGLTVLALPLTFGAAMLSWYAVERPALALKSFPGLPVLRRA